MSTSKSSKWAAPFRWSDRNCICISHLCHACYNFRSSRPSWFGHPYLHFIRNIPSCTFLYSLDASSLSNSVILEFSADCTVPCSVTSVIKREYMFRLCLLEVIRGFESENYKLPWTGKHWNYCMRVALTKYVHSSLTRPVSSIALNSINLVSWTVLPRKHYVRWHADPLLSNSCSKKATIQESLLGDALFPRQRENSQ